MVTAADRLFAALKAAAADYGVEDLHKAVQRLLTKVVGEVANLLILAGYAEDARQLVEATVDKLELELEQRLDDATAELEMLTRLRSPEGAA